MDLLIINLFWCSNNLHEFLIVVDTNQVLTLPISCRFCDQRIEIASSVHLVFSGNIWNYKKENGADKI